MMYGSMLMLCNKAAVMHDTRRYTYRRMRTIYVSTRCYADPELGRPRYSRNGCDAPSGVGTGEEHWKSIHNS